MQVTLRMTFLTARCTLPPEQLEPFKEDLKEWLVDYPPAPGRQLLFADLKEIDFDFSFLLEGVEVVDPPPLPSDDEETAGEHVESGSTRGRQEGDGVLGTSLPMTPDSLPYFLCLFSCFSRSGSFVCPQWPFCNRLDEPSCNLAVSA